MIFGFIYVPPFTIHPISGCPPPSVFAVHWKWETWFWPKMSISPSTSFCFGISHGHSPKISLWNPLNEGHTSWEISEYFIYFGVLVKSGFPLHSNNNLHMPSLLAPNNYFWVVCSLSVSSVLSICWSLPCIAAENTIALVYLTLVLFPRIIVIVNRVSFLSCWCCRC